VNLFIRTLPNAYNKTISIFYQDIYEAKYITIIPTGFKVSFPIRYRMKIYSKRGIYTINAPFKETTKFIPAYKQPKNFTVPTLFHLQKELNKHIACGVIFFIR